MIIHDVQQGSEAWKALRAKCFTASEAPNMMGAGFKKRADFLKEKALGTEEEFSDFVLKLFAKGHETEALARPIVEAKLDLEFFPVVGTHDTDTDKLASMDGQSVCEKVLFEHKLWNEKVVAQVNAEKLDPKYYWQLEQQLYVSGAEKVIFVCSDGTEDNMVFMTYYPVRGRLKKLLAGWDQFKEDLANFDYEGYEKPAPKLEAVSQDNLPAISYKMNGMELTSNIDAYTEAAEALVVKSQQVIETDQDFADQDALNKQLKKAEDYIKLMKKQVLSEVASIESFTGKLDNLLKLASKARLAGEKQVKARKEELKAELIKTSVQSYKDFIAKVNGTLGEFYLPTLPSDFPTAIKGLKTIESAKSNCNDHLAELKIAANEVADNLRNNIIHYVKETKGYEHLFADVHNIIHEPAFETVVTSRINAFKLKEIERKAEEERITKEALDKADKEREEKQARIDQKAIDDAKVSEKSATEQFLEGNLKVGDFVEANHFSDDVGFGGGATYKVVNHNTNKSPQENILEEIKNPLAQNDQENRFQVHFAIKQTLMAYGVDPDVATIVVTAMKKGEIPRVSIQY